MRRLDIASLRFDGLISREWLLTNGSGAYASSALCNLNTRKYHGLLVAAMSPPVRRMVLLSRLEESVHCGGACFDLAANEYPGTIHPRGHEFLRAFNPDPFPRWAYQADGWTIEKQLRLIHGQNTVVIIYTLLGGKDAVELELRPLFALRGIHELMYQHNGMPEALHLAARHHRIPATAHTPEVFFAHDGQFTAQPCWYLNTIYRREQERGYAGLEDLWMPGLVRVKLSPGQSAHFICSAEPIEFEKTLVEAQRQTFATMQPVAQVPGDGALEELLRAARQFVVADREGVASIIGFYPWGSAAGRDAMISLPGLLLVPGRLAEAQALLRAFAGAIRNGLMPSEIGEDGSGYHYTAADTSLWFVNAVWQYLRYGGDESFVAGLLPAINQMIEAYRWGTGLGIGADTDGLLHTRSPGMPTTWMNAKVGDWVITPRHGRPVEVNALWHNAVCIAAELSERFGHGQRAAELRTLAGQIREAFNRRFWNHDENCCFDVVEDHGTDPSFRPNQLLAISLSFPVLDESRHEMLLMRLERDLLTPVGVRTLATDDPSYQGRYAGPVVARDRACHQGSAFPWLLGPMVTAHLRVFGQSDHYRREALEMLAGSLAYMRNEGLGQICELFDGDAPHHAGGAPACARSVAEILRCYVEDILHVAPGTLYAPPKQAAVIFGQAVDKLDRVRRQ